MTLVLNNKEELQGKPGLHVFIAGVSHYRHLTHGRSDPGEDTYDLNQLAVAATSAFRVYKWLKSHSEHLVAPLATVRLLLSPQKYEEEIDEKVDPCTYDCFSDEVHRWRDDASVSNDDVTFFYFAGHGLIRDKMDSVLLCDDFAQPRRGPMSNVVDFGNILAAMATPAAKNRQRARKQFYFIDACREFPEQLKDFEKPDITPTFKSELSGVDRRIIAVFNAAVSGSKAYASAIEQTLFSKALLECLNGLGGEAGAENDDGTVPWRVTTYSLRKALDVRIEALNKRYQTDQMSELRSTMADIPIYHLEGPPKVDGILEVVPEDARTFVDVEVLDLKQKIVWQPSLAHPYPYQGNLTAGSYFVRATIREPPKPPYIVHTSDPKRVEPPGFILKARPLQ